MLTKTYKNLTQGGFLLKFFDIFNALQNNPDRRVTKSQAMLLTEFLLLEDKFKYNRFRIQGKRKVQEGLKQKYDWDVSITNINIFIRKMKDKGIIVEDTDKMKYLNPSLQKIFDKVVQEGKLNISFKFEWNGGD